MKQCFYGGVHPAGNKELSCGKVPVKAPIPRRVIIPMSQHIGKPCTPLVSVGDQVKLGQKIGDGEGLCVPVHASVSGTVEDIREYPHPSGRNVLSVVISNDYLDTPAHELVAHLEPEKLSREELLNTFRQAGVVGMGGATFPTYVKAGGGDVEVLIANACECEPYITADDALLRTYPDIVLKGLRIMRKILNDPITILAIEDNKKEAIQILRKRMAYYPGITLAVLPTRYPQGSEKQLIQKITGRQIPPGGLPKDVGCSVFNVATLSAIYKAVYEGTPNISRIVTVTGGGVKEPQNFVARIGTPFEVLIEAAGGLTGKTEKVLAGGPMMGVAQSDLSAPVVKGTNAIVCLEHQGHSESTHPTCIRCGKCVAACPMKLQPLYLYRCEATGDLEGLERLHLMDCTECGCCTYICPGKLPLTERFRAGKRAMKEGKKP